jgi:predicted DNA-binding transcriptional regulator YafY
MELNKFDRVISMLVILQSRRTVTAAELAEKFDVSLRTIYRDIKTLSTAGVPIIGEAGMGYSLVRGYRLPPVMLNEGEAMSLLTAQKFISRIGDRGMAMHFNSALSKIRAVLRSQQKDMLEVLDDSILPMLTSEYKNQDYLELIFRAITNAKVIKIAYQKPSDENAVVRDAEPMGCYFHFDNWYLIAYCRLKKAYRTFRVSRIQRLEIQQESFQDLHPSLEEYLNQEAKRRKRELVSVRFQKSVLDYTNSGKKYFGCIQEELHEDYADLTFLVASLDDFAPWLLSFSDAAEVIGPEELKGKMRAQAERLYRHYQ